MKTNPLLQKTVLPKFDKIRPEHFKPAITSALKNSSAIIKKLLVQKKYSWKNLIEPLENTHEYIAFIWSTISHFNGVMSTKEIRTAYESCLPLVTKYFTEISQNTKLYHALEYIIKNTELNSIQARIIENELRDFRLAGVNLPLQKKQLFKQLTQKLSKLENKFSCNVLDATQIWSINLNKNQIKGLPEYALAMGKTNATKKNKSGWLFSLDFPSYHALITFADSRSVRKKIHNAFIARASRGKLDNSKIIKEILKIRLKLSKLVNFNNYAEYSLATKMAKDTTKVLDFLNSLADRVLTIGKKEATEIKQFAKKLGCKKLESWDIAYYEEKLNKEKFNFSSEDLRPYFQDSKVLSGMFSIANKLYGITIKEKKDVAILHPTVKFFEIYDNKKTLLGQFYADLYCRENKRSGAWMNECKPRRRLKNNTIQVPVAHLVCNFPPPINNKPSSLNHQDVITLFHEFGHCLHHLLTKVDYTAVSGTRNVPWDAVELPSQFMENWCWKPESLKLFSKPIPKKLLKNLLESNCYLAATRILQQLKFSLIDFRIHLEFDPKKINQLQKIIDEINKKINFLPISKLARPAHSFKHIFAGGYAAGYYSYKWAEVLSADAFSKFEENGIFDRRTGGEFLQNILEKGGSEDMMILFKKFRGREPSIDALLKHNGII